MRELLIVIPAFNEEQMIGKVIDSIPRHLKGLRTQVLVVDDGSIDMTVEVARAKKVKVVSHVINRGLGGALGTGFQYALNHDYDFIVTFDADGQHQAEDIEKIIKPLVDNSADVVIGSRMLKPQGMPLTRRVVNWFSNLATLILFNIWTTDSQSGLRAFTKDALHKMRIRSERMEVSSEFFKEIARLRLRYKEVPIGVRYTKYSLTKGQPVTNAPHVFWQLVLNRLS